MNIQGKRMVTCLALAVLFLAAGIPGGAGAAEKYSMPRRSNVLRDMLEKNNFTGILNGRVLIPDAEVPLSGLVEAFVENDAEVAEADLPEPESEPVAGYILRYETEDGTLLLSEEIADGTLAQAEDLAPVREGFFFLYWVNSETGEEFSFDQPLSGDVTLHPVYEAEGAEAEPEHNASLILQLGEVVANTPEPEQEAAIPKPESILGIPTAAPQEPETEEAEEVEETAREVRVRLETNGPLNLGDSFTLRAELDGYAEGTYSLRWQCYQDGAWQDIEGEHGASLTQTLTRENAGYSWRVLVDH